MGKRVCVGVFGVASVLTACTGNGEKEPQPSQTTSSANVLALAADFLGRVARCSADDSALVTSEGSYLVLDGRCDDDDPNAPVGIYPTAEQSIQPEDGSSASLARAYTGAVFLLEKDACVLEAADGQSIGDSGGNSSTRWVRVKLDPTLNAGLLEVDHGAIQGFVPDVWVRGDDGLPYCAPE
jgi:hypothetical protein